MTSNSQISKESPSHAGKPPDEDMVWIPEKTFEMGANNSQYPEEGPVHTVTVSGFWMDRYLVTNKQFQRFVKETGYITFAEKPPEAVGSYPANGYGLYDMIGNVWEWTQDWYREKHLENPTKACCTPKNPKGGKEIDSYDCRLSPSMRKPRKVLKGGSFLCAPNYCARYRPAARHPEDTDTSTNHIGFRTIFCPSVIPEQG